MPILSVIIPVYNVEKYVEKCLDSISNQKINNIEMIIVNDGSEDNSETVIKHWIETNKNKENISIKYLKKTNGGLSDARNFGVTHAEGRYISFVDSDDFIDENLYLNLKEYMDQDIDLIKFKMKTIDENEKIIEKIDGPVFEKCSGEEAFEKLCTIDKFIDPACIYLYKREFFVKNNFKYEVGTYHEDFGLTPLIIVNAESFVSTGEFGYNYLQRENSITGKKDIKKNVKKAKDVLKHYDNMTEKIKKFNINKHTKELLKRYYTNTVILKTKELLEDKEELDKYIKEIKKRKLYKNIKPYNIKQLIKRILLMINVKLYLKMR